MHSHRRWVEQVLQVACERPPILTRMTLLQKKELLQANAGGIAAEKGSVGCYQSGQHS